MIEDCENNESSLSSWERDFIQSVSEKTGIKNLSEKEIIRLEKVWHKVTR
jgi:hypothetical protein